jgi:hypothetical protein
MWAHLGRQSVHIYIYIYIYIYIGEMNLACGGSSWLVLEANRGFVGTIGRCLLAT